MICKVIQKIGLFIFWKCIDENERQENLKKHRYSKINADKVGEAFDKMKERENYVEKVMKEIRDINFKIESKAISLKAVSKKLKQMEDDYYV